MPPQRVSIAVPSYNEAPRLPPFLEKLARELSAASETAIELLIVDDGSREEERAVHRAATEALAAALRSTPHTAVFVESPRNQGKASAIRLGWERARPDAEWFGFLDADGAVPAHEVARLVRMLEDADFDVLASSRVRMAGHTILRSEFRHWQGRVFATLTELSLRLGLYDPQCGYKLFRAQYLRPLLGRLKEKTWMLDVEVMALIARAGGRLREEPIDWADTGVSKVRFGVDAMKMARDLVALRRRLDRESGP
ncbi:MAG: glycosyltransferase [Archangiaceae bacterium]|nr:glycosyltransferase [Archangiaceae bacterium]